MSGPGDDGEGFLARWSRRKRAGQEPEAVASDAAVPDEGAVPDAVAGAGQVVPEEGVPEDPEFAANRAAAEAVDLDSLTYESDFTVFMKRGVPQALKNAALQRLWRSNPVLAVVDGLNDYDINFRTADTVLTQFQSAWEVGKGYAKKAEEMAAEAERLAEAEKLQGDAVDADGTAAQPAAEPAASDETGSRGDEESAEDRPAETAASGRQADGLAEPQAGAGTHQTVETEAEDTVVKVPIRRRMAVRFDDT
ncbi:MAG: DUF3306 domain-containing protein [Roseibium sp.]|nr:DUF3306 domain-containing protein [Roseibium sp.]